MLIYQRVTITVDVPRNVFQPAIPAMLGRCLRCCHNRHKFRSLKTRPFGAQFRPKRAIGSQVETMPEEGSKISTGCAWIQCLIKILLVVGLQRTHVWSHFVPVGVPYCMFFSIATWLHMWNRHIVHKNRNGPLDLCSRNMWSWVYILQTNRFADTLLFHVGNIWYILMLHLAQGFQDWTWTNNTGNLNTSSVHTHKFVKTR